MQALNLGSAQFCVVVKSTNNCSLRAMARASVWVYKRLSTKGKSGHWVIYSLSDPNPLSSNTPTLIIRAMHFIVLVWTTYLPKLLKKCSKKKNNIATVWHNIFMFLCPLYRGQLLVYNS